MIKRTTSLKKSKRQSPAETQYAYFNRELSWLAFDRRVLNQARSTRHPLLERVRFLSIVSSNLDEFFEIRVAGLMQQMDSGMKDLGPDGLSPREQLRRIHSVVASLVEDQYRCWQNELLPALHKNGVEFRSLKDLTSNELNWIKAYFKEQIYPILTPLALDQSHPFPQLGNKTLNVIVSLENPEDSEASKLIAILPVPRILPRLVPISPSKTGPERYIFLSEIIKLCAEELFPGFKLKTAHAFRVTRNSDLYIDDEESENLLKKIEEELRNIRRGAAVRLEIEDGVEDSIFSTLCNHLNLSHEYVFRLKGPINLLRLQSLADIDRPELKYKAFSPVNVSALKDTSEIFNTLREQDVLLHHPYDSFTPVIDFVEQAARDPQVFAIKQTLYRAGGDSPIIRALIEASRNGKQVTALVELKARFDEANNIQWAKQLEEAGVHVVYGLIGHKTHCKLCLVVRQEGKVMRHYAHLGTGNYNHRTARLYTDLSYFTSASALTKDIGQMFNALTGLGRSPSFSKLLVAPYNLHKKIAGLIARETANAKAGKPARIVAKMNALVDKAMIDALYVASEAGVKIDLIIRGICCLVPGMPGLSENISVRSIVGRFLEHARIFYFHNSGAEPLLYAGSADWMPRNFFRRVEVVFPILDPQIKTRVIKEIIEPELSDTQNTSELKHSGAYLPVTPSSSKSQFSSQEYFIKSAQLKSRA
jgi:polyphosphate kinase